MFLKPKFNHILHLLFNNNKDAKKNFILFANKLYSDKKFEPILDIIAEGINQEYYDDSFSIQTLFEPERNSIEICANDFGYMKIDLYTITKKQIPFIPYDPQNDIFLSPELEISSPACFTLEFNPTVTNDNYEGDIDDISYTFYVVLKDDGYYLVSQEMSDAGVHCSKVDLEDFIVESHKQKREVSTAILPKPYNKILSALLKNNNLAAQLYNIIVNDLPKPVIQKIKALNPLKYKDENLQIYSNIHDNNVEVVISNKYKGSLSIELFPINKAEIDNIPLDQNNDIFLNYNEHMEEDYNAYFRIAFNSSPRNLLSSITSPQIEYYLVKKSNGFYLISQDNQSKQIQSTKVKIEDFVVDGVQTKLHPDTLC